VSIKSLGVTFFLTGINTIFFGSDFAFGSPIESSAEVGSDNTSNRNKNKAALRSEGTMTTGGAGTAGVAHNNNILAIPPTQQHAATEIDPISSIDRHHANSTRIQLIAGFSERASAIRRTAAEVEEQHRPRRRRSIIVFVSTAIPSNCHLAVTSRQEDAQDGHGGRLLGNAVHGVVQPLQALLHEQRRLRDVLVRRGCGELHEVRVKSLLEKNVQFASRQA